MPRIEHLTAFIVEDVGPDDEGVPAFQWGNLMMPMMCADQARVDSMRPKAQELANELGKPIKVVLFKQREEVEVIHPENKR